MRPLLLWLSIERLRIIRPAGGVVLAGFYGLTGGMKLAGFYGPATRSRHAGQA